MQKKLVRRCGMLVVALGLMICLTAHLCLPPVFAAESETCSLTLVCEVEDVILSDTTWNFYRVGEHVEDHTYVLTGDFADYPVSMENLTDKAMQDAADTLENYAVLDKIEPDDTGVTDESGMLTVDSLKPGLYLLSGTSKTIGYTEYIPSAILIDLTADGETFDFTAYPKYRVQDTLSGTVVRFTVQKVWMNDDDQPESRSTALKVSIYQDEDLYEEVTLTEENDWSYTWNGLAESDWRVEEVEVPENYTVIYRSNEQQYLIVNTYEEKAPPSKTTTMTTTPSETTVITQTTTQTDQPPVTTMRTNSPGGGSSNSSNSSSRLPQTGQLWWPVPVLIGGGLVCMVIGWRLSKKHKRGIR